MADAVLCNELAWVMTLLPVHNGRHELHQHVVPCERHVLHEPEPGLRSYHYSSYNLAVVIVRSRFPATLLASAQANYPAEPWFLRNQPPSDPSWVRSRAASRGAAVRYDCRSSSHRQECLGPGIARDGRAAFPPGRRPVPIR